MLKGVKITAILPVFNEEKTITQVLIDLSRVEFIDEIIIVDDASTDSSFKLLQSSKDRFVLLHNKINSGKGYSLYKALKRLPADYTGLVIFLDSDILGYSETNISELCSPIINKKYSWTIGTTKYETFRKPGFTSKYIGQRCYKYSDIKNLISRFPNTGKYGLEVLLNHRTSNLSHKLVYLKGTKHMLKAEKRKFPQYMLEYIQEFLSIAKQEIFIRFRW